MNAADRAAFGSYFDVPPVLIQGYIADLFVPGAPVVLDLRDRPPMTFTGAREIGAFIETALEQYPFFEFVALNVRVLLDADPDRAGVRTYMCELRQDHAGTPSRAYGLYQDDVVRTAAGWRFARRRYQSIGRGEQGLDLMPPPEIF